MDDLCERYLQRRLRDIEPTDAQKAGAARSQNYLRDRLDTGALGRRIVDSYLSGSYARQTAIAPLDDVDVIVVIEPQAWSTPWLSTWPTPATVIDSFSRSIRYRYGESTIVRQRRSVCLRLSHIDIDVVPAIVGDSAGTIWVPDTSESRWIRSAPKLHGEAATTANQLTHGLAKPLVKLLKHWNSNLPENTRMKSFVVETIAVRLFSTFVPSNLSDGLIYFWDFVAGVGGETTAYRWDRDVGVSRPWLGGIVVNDTAGLGTNVADGVANERFERFSDRCRIARDKLVSAARARVEDNALERLVALV
jgi:hypothetical protein